MHLGVFEADYVPLMLAIPAILWDLGVIRGVQFGVFGPDAQSLYARARTMIVQKVPFYQKHVQAGVQDTPALTCFGSTDGAWTC